MFKTPAIRLSVALVLLTLNLLFLANMVGFVPDESESALELRKILSESLALIPETPEVPAAKTTPSRPTDLQPPAGLHEAIKSGKWGKLKIAYGYCCKPRGGIGFEQVLGEADYAAGVAGVMALPVADLQEEADPWPVKALASEFDKQLG